jgi:hypothetical protein
MGEADLDFHCPHCSQPFTAPAEMAGQLIDCPMCKRTIEVPGLQADNGMIPAESDPPKIAQKHGIGDRIWKTIAQIFVYLLVFLPGVLILPSGWIYEITSGEIVNCTQNHYVFVFFVGATPGLLLILAAFWLSRFVRKNIRRARVFAGIGGGIIIAVAILIFSFNWTEKKKEDVFLPVAKEALDEAYKMQSALGVGVTYQKYNEELIALATKVDNLYRAASDARFSYNPDAGKFCRELRAARDDYHSAMGWWDIKIKHPEDADDPSSIYAQAEKKLQSDWSDASKEIVEAAKAYSAIKNK